MIKLSSSSMSTYEKCPRKYFYQYIEKPKIELPEWSHLETGTVTHRALELFHEFLMKNTLPMEKWHEVMRDSFKTAIKESNERGKLELIKDNLADIKDSLQNYLAMIKKEGLPPVIHNELDFNFKIQDFTVRGFMDRIDKYDNGVYHVVDYKTNKNPDYLNSFQLALYALALYEIYDDIKEISGSYVLMKHNSKLKTWEFNDKILEDVRQKVIKIGTDINTETLWAKKPTILCGWCDFRSICQDSWTEETW